MLYGIVNDCEYTFDGVLDLPSAHPFYTPKQAVTRTDYYTYLNSKIRNSPHKQTSVSPWAYAAIPGSSSQMPQNC